MKKALFFLPAIVLIAAGCSLAQQSPSGSQTQNNNSQNSFEEKKASPAIQPITFSCEDVLPLTDLSRIIGVSEATMTDGHKEEYSGSKNNPGLLACSGMGRKQNKTVGVMFQVAARSEDSEKAFDTLYTTDQISGLGFTAKKYRVNDTLPYSLTVVSSNKKYTIMNLTSYSDNDLETSVAAGKIIDANLNKY